MCECWTREGNVLYWDPFGFGWLMFVWMRKICDFCEELGQRILHCLQCYRCILWDELDKRWTLLACIHSAIIFLVKETREVCIRFVVWHWSKSPQELGFVLWKYLLWQLQAFWWISSQQTAVLFVFQINSNQECHSRIKMLLRILKTKWYHHLAPYFVEVVHFCIANFKCWLSQKCRCSVHFPLLEKCMSCSLYDFVFSAIEEAWAPRQINEWTIVRKVRAMTWKNLKRQTLAVSTGARDKQFRVWHSRLMLGVWIPADQRLFHITGAATVELLLASVSWDFMISLNLGRSGSILLLLSCLYLCFCFKYKESQRREFRALAFLFSEASQKSADRGQRRKLSVFWSLMIRRFSCGKWTVQHIWRATAAFSRGENWGKKTEKPINVLDEQFYFSSTRSFVKFTTEKLNASITDCSNNCSHWLQMSNKSVFKERHQGYWRKEWATICHIQKYQQISIENSLFHVKNYVGENGRSTGWTCISEWSEELETKTQLQNWSKTKSRVEPDENRRKRRSLVQPASNTQKGCFLESAKLCDQGHNSVDRDTKYLHNSLCLGAEVPYFFNSLRIRKKESISANCQSCNASKPCRNSTKRQNSQGTKTSQQFGCEHTHFRNIADGENDNEFKWYKRCAKRKGELTGPKMRTKHIGSITITGTFLFSKITFFYFYCKAKTSHVATYEDIKSNL